MYTPFDLYFPSRSPAAHRRSPAAATDQPTNRPSQQLQSSRDPVHHALGRRPHAQHGQAARVDLGAPGVLDGLGGDAEGEGLGEQLLQLVERLDLHGDLGLAEALPAAEQAGGGGGGAGLARGAAEGLVAGQGGVGALGCDLAWVRGEKEGECVST